MSNLSVRLIPEVLRSIDSATFTGSYQAIGTPLVHGSTIVKIINNSGVLVTISFDGVNNHDVVPAGSFVLYDATANASQVGGLYIPIGTQFYVKGSASTGSIYLVSLYMGP